MEGAGHILVVLVTLYQCKQSPRELAQPQNKSACRIACHKCLKELSNYITVTTTDISAI